MNSIVPQMLSSKKIKFFDENDLEIELSPSELVKINLDELKSIGFVLTATPVRKDSLRWFRGQKVIYRIEKSSDLSPYSKKLKIEPKNHKIIKDKANNVVRLEGANSGKFKHGPWIKW